MANSLNSNPIIIEGALASYKAAVSASQGTLLALIVTKVRFQPAASGNQLIIDDPSGGLTLTRLAATSTADVVDDYSASPRLWRDFQIAQIDGGRAYIYTK